MSTGWENYEPAPIEFLHGRLMDLFHEWRREKYGKDAPFEVNIAGNELNNIIAKAKSETYKKYEKLKLKDPILKTSLL